MHSQPIGGSTTHVAPFMHGSLAQAPSVGQSLNRKAYNNSNPTGLFCSKSVLIIKIKWLTIKEMDASTKGNLVLFVINIDNFDVLRTLIYIEF